jgi:hypothetical protein
LSRSSGKYFRAEYNERRSPAIAVLFHNSRSSPVVGSRSVSAISSEYSIENTVGPFHVTLKIIKDN